MWKTLGLGFSEWKYQKAQPKRTSKPATTIKILDNSGKYLNRSIKSEPPTIYLYQP